MNGFKKQQTDMEISNIRYRGRIDAETWVYGQEISIRDGVITINGRYVIPDTLGIATGLIGQLPTLSRSKPNKREIYDGDVVTRKGVSGNYLVRFDQKRAAFRLIPTVNQPPKDQQAVFMNAAESYIILGNIHDDRYRHSINP